VNSGAVVSSKVMVCCAWLLFPASSVAVKVRTMVKLPAAFPGMVSLATSMETSPQLSEATASSRTKLSEHSLV